MKSKRRPLSLHPKGATMKLIERFAAFRKRTTMEVLRAYKGQPADVQRSMLADMQRLMDEAAAKAKADEEAANTATMGDPGAGRFERIMRRQALIEKCNETVAKVRAAARQPVDLAPAADPWLRAGPGPVNGDEPEAP